MHLKFGYLNNYCIVHTNLSINGKKKVFMYKTIHVER